jgi:TolB-like protein
MKVTIFLLALLMVGCSSVADKLSAIQKEQIEVIPRVAYQPELDDRSLHAHVEQLARQLFDTTNAFDVSRPVIVGTFLPADSLGAEENANIVSYGLQLQESLTTFATQAGLNVVEFKTLPSVKVNQSADIMLSRSVEDLSERVAADYMLTGTYVQQESNLMVNARLIRIFDKTIIAAATDYVPMSSMWSHSKVKLKNNQLYRGEY